MKKGTKIFLIILTVLVVIGAAAFIGADVVVSRYVKKNVDKALADLPFGEASCGEIQIRLFSGTAGVKNLHFGYAPGLEVRVDEIEVGRVFYSALLNRKIMITDIRIMRPTVTIQYDSKHPEDFFPKMDDNGLKKAAEFLSSANLDRLKIRDASLNIKDMATGIEVLIDSTNLRFYDLTYNFADSTFLYNDSVYSVEVGSLTCYVPKEPMQIEVLHLETENAGPLTSGYIRIHHACDKRKLAARKHEPATWIDMRAGNVRTSAFNLFHKALNKDLNLDSVSVDINHIDIYRDARIAPKKPFPMPQTVLLKQPVTLEVKHVGAHVKQLDIEFASTDVNKGEMHLRNISAAVEHATNHRGSTIFIHGQCPIDEGKAKAEMSLKLNHACDWHTKLHVEHVNTNYLNSFLRPLIGMTCDCHIDTIDTNYSGNSSAASGTFRMLYHGLQVKVYKEDDIPYKVITRNADAITQLGNTLIPKSNPTSVDIHPRAYQVEWKRDEWKPFPLFLFGPCIDGAKKTMLPGLYVHKQVQQPKATNTSKAGIKKTTPITKTKKIK